MDPGRRPWLELPTGGDMHTRSKEALGPRRRWCGVVACRVSVQWGIEILHHVERLDELSPTAPPSRTTVTVVRPSRVGTVTYTIEKTITGWNLNDTDTNTFDFQEVS